MFPSPAAITSTVSYAYNAWGNVLSITGTHAATLGELNPLRYRGYVYDEPTGQYYLQSRYYAPNLDRFINADALVSTGQGLLGNNMFAYCNNNPVVFEDSKGIMAVKNTLFIDGGAPSGEYILDQKGSDVCDKKLGIATVAHGGCGAIATYNALLALGNYKSFDAVLSDYNSRPLRLSAVGLAGMRPFLVADYFRAEGYNVIMTDDIDAIDACSKTADACIMYYMYPQTYYFLGFIPIDAYGAHFVCYEKCLNGYVGYNTGADSGKSVFRHPSDYGYSDGQFYAIGIFIYE